MPQPCPDKNLLKRDGLSQPQRRLAALQPENIQIDERMPEDLLRFAALYAKEADIRFFDLSNTADNGETWEELMDYERYFQLGELASRSDIEPHFALFLSFLHLFGQLQNHQNTLTSKHLDFYYKEVLQLTNRAPVPDRVHVVFELAKNAADQIVGEKTGLDAGKDSLRQPLIYQTTSDLTVNRAKISHLRTVYIHADGRVYYAPTANTRDGVAEPLPPDNPTWNAFGPKARTEVTCGGPPPGEAVNLPEAQLGFALASPVLLLAEGNRAITVTLKAADAATAKRVDGHRLKIQLSGQKAWLEAGELTARVTGNVITLAVTLLAEVKEAVVAYDVAKLDGGYATNAPTMRCWLANSSNYDAWRKLQISTIKIDVKVTGIKKSLILENDLGQVSPEKPFMPFGPTPVVDAALYVGCGEAVAKKLTSVTVELNDWVGRPANWSTYYNAYGNTYTNQSAFTASVEILNGNRKADRSADKPLFPNFTATVPTSAAATVESSSGATFGVMSESTMGGSMIAKSMATIPTPFNQYKKEWGVFSILSAVDYIPFGYETATKSVSDSLLKIRLNKDFGHGVYPQKLTQGVIDQSKPSPGPQLIPNPPYTPVVKEIILNYDATTDAVSLTNTDFDSFAKRPLQLFHLAAFGQAEEHWFLKTNRSYLTAADQSSVYLVPQYNPQGTFFMGLQDVGPLEAVAILFQVEEGSANPQRRAATVEWSVLCQDQWRPLTVLDILSDTTNHLLTSGIIKFYIPKETSVKNTLLEPGFVWLRAELRVESQPAPIDSVSNLVALHPQAVLAGFTDKGNESAHYNAPLPAETIRKSRQSLASVKAIKQPYASFGGKPKETDEAFYIRVSERLRHKQRAVSIWDYEHLILQAFPSVYKVKCLNHTKMDGQTLQELVPGHVTVVVVPDLRILSAVNLLEPQVDLNTLSTIQQFLQRRAGRQIGIRVVNPNYERVKLDFEVAFRQGYEAPVYRQVLQQDLIAYLTPWAFDTTADVPFGGTVSKSVIIKYIERRPYVDFLTDLTMKQFVNGIEIPVGDDLLTASDARAVLTSCMNHTIRDFDGC